MDVSAKCMACRGSFVADNGQLTVNRVFNSIEVKYQCPYPGCAFKVDAVTSNTAAINLHTSSKSHEKIACVHEDCNAEIWMCDKSHHEETDCLAKFVCKNNREGCRETLRVCEMEAHEQVCEHRSVDCEVCGVSHVLSKKERHDIRYGSDHAEIWRLRYLEQKEQCEAQKRSADEWAKRYQEEDRFNTRLTSDLMSLRSKLASLEKANGKEEAQSEEEEEGEEEEKNEDEEEEEEEKEKEEEEEEEDRDVVEVLDNEDEDEEEEYNRNTRRKIAKELKEDPSFYAKIPKSKSKGVARKGAVAHRKRKH
jgi:hypothetical protein